MRYVIAIALGAVIAGGVAYWRGNRNMSPTIVPVSLPSSPSPSVSPETEVSADARPETGEHTAAKDSLLSQPAETKDKSSLIASVPFTSQAPFGEWNDPIFQNGCEEAVLTMVHFFFSDRLLTPTVARKEIVALSAFAKQRFGYSVDTSAEDTLQLFREYYGYSGGVVEYAVDGDDIRGALEQKTFVIVPADGRKLKNPHFRQPGPTTHMLLVIGYDAQTGEFVTNDPGTRHGARYRYAEHILVEAIRDYPTGDHRPIREERTAMIRIPIR